jgi:autoinducer 2-degrading protein
LPNKEKITYIVESCELISAVSAGGNLKKAEIIMATRYCLNVALTLKPERVDEFLKIMQNSQLATLTTEPAARQFVVGRSQTNPNEFFLHEEYDDLAAFQAHTRTPHYQAWSQFVETNPFSADIRADFYETVPPLLPTDRLM